MHCSNRVGRKGTHEFVVVASGTLVTVNYRTEAKTQFLSLEAVYHPEVSWIYWLRVSDSKKISYGLQESSVVPGTKDCTP